MGTPGKCQDEQDSQDNQDDQDIWRTPGNSWKMQGQPGQPGQPGRPGHMTYTWEPSGTCQDNQDNQDNQDEQDEGATRQRGCRTARMPMASAPIRRRVVGKRPEAMGEPANRQGQQASKDSEGPGVTKSHEGCRSGQGEQAEIAQRDPGALRRRRQATRPAQKRAGHIYCKS